MFSLGGWTLRFQSGFHVPRPTRENKYDVSYTFVYEAFTLYGAAFQLLPLA